MEVAFDRLLCKFEPFAFVYLIRIAGNGCRAGNDRKKTSCLNDQNKTGQDNTGQDMP
jgi:hypothetical protein